MPIHLTPADAQLYKEMVMHLHVLEQVLSRYFLENKRNRQKLVDDLVVQLQELYTVKLQAYTDSCSGDWCYVGKICTLCEPNMPHSQT